MRIENRVEFGFQSFQLMIQHLNLKLMYHLNTTCTQYSQWVARRGHSAGASVADAVCGRFKAYGGLIEYIVVI